MSLRLKTAATVEPVATPDFIQHARITLPEGDDAERLDIEAKLKAARRSIEKRHGRAVINSTWQYYLAAWPDGNYIEVPLGNLQSVTSVNYTDSTDTEKTFASSKYHLIRTYSGASGDASDAGFGRIVLDYSESWPSDTLQTGEPICVEFVCGWKDADSVPDDVKLAIELEAADMYQNRESDASTAAVKRADCLMSAYSDVRF